MAIAGIIAEYNPLHGGHLRQLRRVRELLGAETAVVCAMSGNFVQRGDFALLPKHARAEAAVRSGADLVLELPLSWAAAPAERFAQGGVEVLTGTGLVTHLIFGSESGDMEQLERVAACLDGREYPTLLKEQLEEVLDTLTPREKKIMELRFGLYGNREYTQKQVADMMGISQSYISRLEKRIIQRLKKEILRLS